MSTFVEFVKQSYGIVEQQSIPKELFKQLNIKPIEVFERPFAVVPVTGLMQHGGFFDVSRGEQLIGIYVAPNYYVLTSNNKSCDTSPSISINP